MLRLAADENFNHDIVRGIIRRNAQIDIVQVQTAGLAGADDPTVLEWAAQAGRVLLTHDAATIPTMPMSEFVPVKPCQACSRCAEAFRSDKRSKTFSSLLNVA